MKYSVHPARMAPILAYARNLHEHRPMAARPKVLIVDGNSDVRRLYAIGLNQRGFEVKLAANGAEAVDRIASERRDVILLDWVMPLMDGGEMHDKIPYDSAAV